MANKHQDLEETLMSVIGFDDNDNRLPQTPLLFRNFCIYSLDFLLCFTIFESLTLYRTKLYLSDLKTQFVPRSKRFLPRLQKPIS
jgi:hypothetical protein